MRVKVQALRVRGLLIRADQPPRVGELIVAERRDVKLGRAVTTAKLIDQCAGDVDLLPEIYDARLLWVNGADMRLTGIERTDDAEYAQTWKVEVERHA